ncbi:MAG TPA: GTPase RsgA, partial [Longimicrobium sp.]|nr:GTPase RsgA [Longimicrobium sp.]
MIDQNPSSASPPDDSNFPASPLAALGWDAHWAAAFAAHAPPGTTPARVIARHRGRWVISGAGGERDAVLAGRLRHASAPEDFPTVGDWVAAMDGGGDGAAVIAGVLPRRSAFVRKAAGETTTAQVMAANVDVALVLTSPDDLSARRIERYLTLAWESGAVPVVALTKADACGDV